MRYLLLAAIAVPLAACGGAAPAHRTTQRATAAPELVAFQRNGGLAATLDTVTVRADGTTRSDNRYGGAGRRYYDFHQRPDLLRHLRGALARLPRAGTGDRGGDIYLLRYHGRTYWARQGAVPAVLRPAVAELAAIADAAGRSGHVTAVRQAPA